MVHSTGSTSALVPTRVTDNRYEVPRADCFKCIRKAYGRMDVRWAVMLKPPLGGQK